MVSDDRGQLILVGAIAIALVLLGMVLIVNTALFTQIVGSEGTVESAKEGGTSGQEIGNAIGAVVAEENRNGGDITSINVSAHAAVNDKLRSALANRSIEGSGAFLSLSYLQETESGTLIKQESPSTFTSNNGSSRWEPIRGSVAGEVGEFSMTVFTDRGNGGDLTIDFGSTELELHIDTTDDEVTIDDGTTTCSDIEATQDTVRIDIRHGTVYESNSCQFDALDPSGTYSVEYSGDLSEIEGTYTIATNSTVDDDFRYDGGSDPSVSDAIWAFAYEFEYDSADATVTSDRRVVDVYD